LVVDRRDLLHDPTTLHTAGRIPENQRRRVDDGIDAIIECRRTTRARHLQADMRAPTGCHRGGSHGKP
jgi:hypothetical protein